MQLVAALDGDFRRRPFGRVLELVPLAEEVTKLSAVCVSCTRAAAFTKRTVASEALELVGGAESYVPTCRECFSASSSAPPTPPKRSAPAGAAPAGGSDGRGGPDGEEEGAARNPSLLELASPPFLQRLEAVVGGGNT